MPADPSQLRCRPDGSFTIVQFTDTHFQTGRDQDLRTRELMQRVIEIERPDLVVLTGDVIEGDSSPDPAFAWRFAVGPMERARIPWAAVFGNHDDEGPLSRQQLLDVQRSCAVCLTQRGPDSISGIGNFMLPIMAMESAGESEQLIEAAMFFLDSGAYAPAFRGKYAWLQQNQIQWFVSQATAMRLQHGADVPLLAFFHIPLPEFEEVWDAGGCRGSKFEKVCCPKHNSGFFDALKRVGGDTGVFVGHDHINDYEGRLDGIRLCYGRATGFSTYGQEGFARGARIIRLMQGLSGFQTWVRLMDGSRR